MRAEFNYTIEERDSIRVWKEALPINEKRKFIYTFLENGKRDESGYKLYDYKIMSDDKYSLIVAKNVSL
jgi:hypothetical protein